MLDCIGISPRITASFIRPSDATQYTAGDAIASTATNANVLPLTFVMPRRSGRITGCSCVVTPASSTLVVTACDFNLLLFRPETGIPFAAGAYIGDNKQMDITAAAFRQCVAKFSFVNGAWANPLGALTAGATGYQAVVATTSRPYATYDITGLQPQVLLGVVQAIGVWNPGAVANTIDFALDLDLN